MASNHPHNAPGIAAPTSATVLGPVIGSGGEAEIFALANDPHRVFKRFRKINRSRRAKLEAMLCSAPDDPQRRRRAHVSICWPEAIELDDHGNVLGYLMPRMDVASHHQVALYWNPEDRQALAPGFTWKYLCVAALNIASVVELVHHRGHVIGDLNDENFLVNDRALATLVDCDSMQIRVPDTGVVHRCPVVREPYITPEMIGRNLADVDRAETDDRWALAVLVFQLLMEGHHPANGIGYPEERAARIADGIFPFLGEPGFALPQHAMPFEILPPDIQALFKRCFREGHETPSMRPTAGEWRLALQQLAGTVAQCASKPLHWYAPHLVQCPWCQQAQAIGIDRFAAFEAGSQVAMPPQASSAAANPALAPTPSSGQSAPAAAVAAKGSGATFMAVGGVLALFGLALYLSIAKERNVAASPPPSSNLPAAANAAPPSEAPSAPKLYQWTQQSNAPAAPPTFNTTPGPSTLNEAPEGRPVSPGSPASAYRAPSPPPSPDPSPSVDAALGPNSVFPLTSYPVPSALSTMTSYGAARFSVSYPVGWEVHSAPNTPDAVAFYAHDSAWTRPNGQRWFMYGISVEVAPLPAGASIRDVAAFVVQQKRAEVAGTLQSGETSTATTWGTALYTDLQVPTTYNYTEYTRVVTMPAPNGLVIIMMTAPKPTFDQTLPLFGRVINSLQLPPGNQ